MPKICTAYWCRPDRYTAGGNSCRYIVIHYTANTAPAINEAKNIANNRGQSSFHYTLDGSGTIYQCLYDYDTAWAVGAWSGTTQLIGNNESISIEVCNSGGAFTSAQISELQWLVTKLMKLHSIPASRVVRHFDCHTGRKACPQYYAGFNSSAWTSLHKTITTATQPAPKVSAGTHMQVTQGDKYQMWKMEEVGDGCVMLKNVATGFYLDVKDGSAVHRQPVRAYKGNKTKAQMWKVRITSNNALYKWFYLESALNSNFVLACKGGAKTAGTGTVLGEFDGATAQRWGLVWAGLDNTYYVVNQVSGMYLTCDKE